MDIKRRLIDLEQHPGHTDLDSPASELEPYETKLTKFAEWYEAELEQAEAILKPRLPGAYR